jgi:ABC-type transporter Mla subunit MlaD
MPDGTVTPSEPTQTVAQAHEALAQRIQEFVNGRRPLLYGLEKHTDTLIADLERAARAEAEQVNDIAAAGRDGLLLDVQRESQAYRQVNERLREALRTLVNCFPEHGDWPIEDQLLSEGLIIKVDLARAALNDEQPSDG